MICRCGHDWELEHHEDGSCMVVGCKCWQPPSDDFDADELGLDPEEEYDA